MEGSLVFSRSWKQNLWKENVLWTNCRRIARFEQPRLANGCPKYRSCSPHLFRIPHFGTGAGAMEYRVCDQQSRSNRSSVLRIDRHDPATLVPGAKKGQTKLPFHSRDRREQYLHDQERSWADQQKVKTQEKLGRHFSWSSAHFRGKFPCSDVESLQHSRRPLEMSEKFDTDSEVYIWISEHAVMFAYWNISDSLNLIAVL